MPWIIRHPTYTWPLLKLVALGATQWTDRLPEALQFRQKEEAEAVAVRVSALYPWCMGKLVVEYRRKFYTHDRGYRVPIMVKPIREEGAR